GLRQLPDRALSDLQRPQRGAAMSATTLTRAPRRAIRPSRVLIYVVLVAFAAFYLMPVYVLLVTGLKSFTEVSLDRMWDLPESFSLDSFADAWLGKPPAARPWL